MATERTLFGAVGGAVLALLVALGGYGLYKGFSKRQESSAIVAAVSDTTVQLRAALAAPASPDAVVRIDSLLATLKTSAPSALGDAAQQYVVGAREIVRRRVEGVRLARQAAASRQALAAHMNGGGRRNEAWFHNAMDLKKKVEREHADLDRNFKVLDELLYNLPDSEKLLASQLGTARFIERAALSAARQQAQDDARRAAAELQKARQITP